LCPLGKMRLTIPCRALTCSHLQCFDATLYIQMNEKKPTWVCPVCDKKAPYEHLIIDGLFMEILKFCTDCDEIQFKEDGSWAPMRSKKEVQEVTASYNGVDGEPGLGWAGHSPLCSFTPKMLIFKHAFIALIMSVQLIGSHLSGAGGV
uniref:SP-RING-type domain-containing protein n=1 Tax=Zonotrichia albicollis TaxID=44394 RepID=A0A8D2QA88_ZONAL